MAFQRLLIEATQFIADQHAAYNDHLRTISEMASASEDALWEIYLEMQTCEPPPTYFTDMELVLWYVNKVNPHPSLVLAIPERRELEHRSPAFMRFFQEKQRLLDDHDRGHRCIVVPNNISK